MMIRFLLRSPEVRRGLLIGMILSWVGMSAPSAQGQGLLRRLGDRIRNGPPAVAPRPPIGPLRRVLPPNVQQPPTVTPRRVQPQPPTPLGFETERSSADPARSTARYRISPRTSAPPRGAVRQSPDRGADQGVLGVEAREVTRPVPGVEIVRIFPHSRVDEAGLRLGDIVIGMNGRDVTSVNGLAANLRDQSPGSQHRLRIIRGRVAYDTTVTLVSQKDREPSPVLPSPMADESLAEQASELGNLPEPPANGSTAATMDDLAERLGMTIDPDANDRRGVTLQTVQPDSLAARSGLRPGDRIVVVRGRLVRGPADLSRLVVPATAAYSVPIKIVRDEKVADRLLRLRAAEPATVASAADDGPQGDPDQGEPAVDAASSTLKGIGNVLGGLFGGGNRAANGESPKSSPTTRGDAAESHATEELPAPKPLVQQDDEMAFGDSEPIDEQAFDQLPERESP